MGLIRYRRVGTTLKTSIVAAISLAVVLGPTTQMSSSAQLRGSEHRPIGAGLEVNTSQLSGDQAEPFIAVAPRDPRRIVTAAIDFGDDQGPLEGDLRWGTRRKNVYISSDGGGSWEVVRSPLTADLTVTADDRGTFWILGMRSGDGFEMTDLRVARIPSRGSAVEGTTALPRTPGGVGPDKPLITIDNSRASPTYGRLYAVWDESGSNGYLGAFLTYCDTRVKGEYAPQRCDETENWATPFQLVQGGGWIWAPDIATGPNGEVFVVWMDIVTFTVRGTMCSSECTSMAAFTSADVIARPRTPDASCLLAAGRVRQSPRVAVDLSRGPNRGRVYVSWIDRRVTDVPVLDAYECALGTQPGSVVGEAPSLDVYVASEIGGLPGPTSEASLVYADGERDIEGKVGAALSDEFYPSVAVDEQTGAAWISFYSTRLDKSRRATNVYARRLTTGADGMKLSPLTRVSSQIDLSEGDRFGFYYGDYAGLDVVEGWPYPVWVGNGDGKDVYTWVPRGGRAP